jgi:hypothetical protein
VKAVRLINRFLAGILTSILILSVFSQEDPKKEKKEKPLKFRVRGTVRDVRTRTLDLQYQPPREIVVVNTCYLLEVTGTEDTLPQKTVITSFVHREERIIVKEPPELKPPLDPYIRSFYATRPPKEKSHRNMWVIKDRFRTRHKMIRDRCLPGFYYVKLLIYDFEQYPRIKPKIPKRDDRYESRNVIRLGYLGEIAELLKQEPEPIASYFLGAEKVLKEMREIYEQRKKEKEKEVASEQGEKGEEVRERPEMPKETGPNQMEKLMEKLKERLQKGEQPDFSKLMEGLGAKGGPGGKKGGKESIYSKEELERFAKALHDLISQIWRHELKQPDAVRMPVTLTQLRESLTGLLQSIMAQLQPMMQMFGMQIPLPEEQLPKTEAEFKNCLVYFNHEYYLILKYDLLLLGRDMLVNYRKGFEGRDEVSEDFIRWREKHMKGLTQMLAAHEKMLECISKLSGEIRLDFLPKDRSYKEMSMGLELKPEEVDKPNPRAKDLDFGIRSLIRIQDLIPQVLELRREVREIRAEIAELEADPERDQQRMDELIARLRETQEALRETQSTLIELVKEIRDLVEKNPIFIPRS